jgi:biotin operon repressor
MEHLAVAGEPVAQVPLWVLDRCKGLPSWVYARLSVFAGGEQAIEGHSLPELGRMLGLSPRAVQRYLAELNRAGAVDIQHRVSETGKRLPNRIMINKQIPERAADYGQMEAKTA